MNLRTWCVYMALSGVCGMLCGCGETKTEAIGTIRRQYVVDDNLVGIVVLRPVDFQKELVSNGKLMAQRKTTLQFATGEKLVSVRVKNGDRVVAGQEIARLEQTRLREAVLQADAALQKARMELIDGLLTQGYALADTLHIPAEIYQHQKIRSGYVAAGSMLLNARLNLEGSVIVAPFNGIIANHAHKVHEWINPGTEFCSLIDDAVFEVEFTVMETELNEVAPGKPVRIRPFSGALDFKGVVTEINPLVDLNGLIRVRAVIKGQRGLLEGMNVRVLMEDVVPRQLVVPKKAVVLRQNQEVLFKYASGKAVWTYVTILHENSTSYAVVAHTEKGGELTVGDTVIISGNLDLAHDSPVKIQ